MACCGRTRSSGGGIVHVGAGGVAAKADVLIRYLAQDKVQIGGPATGRHYVFSGAAPLVPVDARDAAALLRTRYFRSG